MKSIITILVFLACSSEVLSQSDVPDLKETGASFQDILPSKWRTLASKFGDLNQDGIEDLVFAIQNTDESNLEKSEGIGRDTIDLNPRILGIYFGTREGRFVKRLQSNGFIILQDSPTMDEPLADLHVTKSGVLKIDFNFWFSAGSWTTSSHSYKFRFQDNKFALIGYDSSEAHRGSGETTDYSINFLTRKMSITKGNFSTDDPKKVEWKNFKLDELNSLESMKKPFEWAFEGIHL